MRNKALIVVDYQEDFCPSGALAVPGGHQIYVPLVHLMTRVDIIVFTRDWHPADHCSFSNSPEYRDGSWPSHCVMDTTGAQIDDATWDAALETGKPIILVNKGFDKTKEAYSGFDGVTAAEHTLNRYPLGESLADALRSLEAFDLLIGGLALDYCVKATALDAAKLGFHSTVYLDATRPVDYLTGGAAIIEMMNGNVEVRSDELWR